MSLELEEFMREQNARTAEMPPEPEIDLEAYKQTLRDQSAKVRINVPGMEVSKSEQSNLPQVGEPAEVPKDHVDETLAAGERGGSSGTSEAAVAVPEQVDVAVESPDLEVEENVEAVGSTVTELASDALTEAQIETGRLSDYQDDAQDLTSAATATKSRGGGPPTELPNTGFRLHSEKASPQIRQIPQVIEQAMRAAVSRAARDELDVTEQVAAKFAKDLSLGSLVTAALLAQFDVEATSDPGTALASELFRRRDPFLGTLHDRLETAERRSINQGTQMAKALEQLGESQKTQGVVEQMLSYLLAERMENLNEGKYLVSELPITHKSAIEARDVARAATAKRQQLEKDREGRPTR